METERRKSKPPPKAPDNDSYQGAVRGLIDRKYLKSLEQRGHWQSLDLKYAHPELADFLGRLRRRCSRMGIPIRVEGGATSYDVAYVVHGCLGRQLTPKQWEVLAHLGREISRQYRLHVEWGGQAMPSTWLHHSSLPGF